MSNGGMIGLPLEVGEGLGERLLGELSLVLLFDITIGFGFHGFALEHIEAVESLLASVVDLETIDGTGGKEVEGGLYPKGNEFGADIVKVAAHATEAQEAAHAKGRWEHTGHVLPDGGHVGLRPRDAGHEE